MYCIQVHGICRPSECMLGGSFSLCTISARILRGREICLESGVEVFLGFGEGDIRIE